MAGSKYDLAGTVVSERARMGVANAIHMIAPPPPVC